MQSGMGWGEGRTLATGLPALAGEEYVACVPDDSSGAVALVAFSAAPEGPLAPEACGALCFAAGQALAALSEHGRCLCGSAQPHNSSSACLPSCSGPSLPPAPACRGPSLLQHIFPASPGAALLGPQGPLASGQPAAFHVTASLPVSSTHWDFGDGSPEVDVAGPDATHRYVLPGRYPVTAVLALGAGSARLGAEVRVEAAPADLELVCVASVHSDETLQLGVRNRGGSGLEAAYSIVALGEEPAQGGACPGHVGWADRLGWAHADACLCPLPPVVHPLCPSDTEIFPGNGHCYSLRAEKASWAQAQEQCRAWAGAALAMVDSPAVQHFLVSRVTRCLPGHGASAGAASGRPVGSRQQLLLSALLMQPRPQGARCGSCPPPALCPPCLPKLGPSCRGQGKSGVVSASRTLGASWAL